MRALAAAAVLCAVACEPVQKPTPSPRSGWDTVAADTLFPRASPATSRYQIVNGTPEMTRNIMLLDTWTGDTWIICADKTGLSAWCAMDRDYEQAKASR